MTFYQKLDATIKAKNSLLCVGLDPDRSKFPQSLRQQPDALLTFCAELIASTRHVAAAFKINFAFFEAEGAAGWQALEKLVALIPDDTLKLADAKRADIGTSSEMYARAILDRLAFDAVTVNPYMGRDSVAPFLERENKGAFILGVTSNPGARDVQHLTVNNQPLYATVIRSIMAWNTYHNCGLVVGATHPQQMREVRETTGDMPFLIPGVGAQGGGLRETILHGTDSTGGRALINSSRGILYKSTKDDFAEAAAKEAERLCAEINHLRAEKCSNRGGGGS